ncbi:MAG: acyl-CoA dehydrogenase family protein [Planctomycetaceae bacterium]
MEFILSQPQQLLQQAARTLLARVCPRSRSRELIDCDSAFDAGFWQSLIDEGWLGLHLPEALGGLGQSVVELAVVMEELGRICGPTPFLANLWAATLVAGAKNPTFAERFLEPLLAGRMRSTVAYLESDSTWDPADIQLLAEKVPGGHCLYGTKHLVLDAGVADVVWCVARASDGLMIAAVPAGAPGLTLRATPTLDVTRRFHSAEFEGVVVAPDCVLATGATAHEAVERSLGVMTAALCAELVGVMQWVLEATVEYAKTREQFGRPIGSFQAVQHRCADMLLWTESARSAMYAAAWAVSERGCQEGSAPDFQSALSVAKAYCSDAARDVCAAGVQVHGGIGMTWENDLSLYFKRATSNQTLLGDATFHRDRLFRLIADAPANA